MIYYQHIAIPKLLILPKIKGHHREIYPELSMTDGYHEITNTMSKPIILQQIDKN